MALPYEPRIALEGDGEPLVLVPGMDGTGRLFYRQVPLLARRYRVGTYTLRDDADRMDVLVEDLASVVRAVSPSGAPAVVIGFRRGMSLGPTGAADGVAARVVRRADCAVLTVPI